MENLIEINQRQQASLELAKAAFFRNGGKVEVIETVQFCAPLPSRKEPKLCASEIRQREIAARIRTMAATLNRAEIAREIGITYNRACEICSKYGIKTLSGRGRADTGNHPVRFDPAADPAMAAQIESLLAQGYSKTKTAKAIGVGSERLNRIIDKYKIDWKKK